MSTTSICAQLAVALAWIGLTATGLAAQAGTTVGSLPADHLTPRERADFFLGKALFERPWANGLASSSSSDGLGPLFNARACANCHGDGGRSDAIVHADGQASHVVLAVVADAGTHPVLGKQLQERASPGLQAEGQRHIRTVSSVFAYPDGETVELLRPEVAVTLSEAAAQAGADAVEFAPRVSPQVWAVSAIGAVPQEQILAWADPDDADGNGISGRVRWGFSLHAQQRLLGRFGWKATAPTLEDQVANAFATDMGLSNRLIVADQGDCTAAQQDCFKAAAYADDPREEYEVRDEVFALVVAYNRGLATPAFSGSEELRVEGLALFEELSCQACHRHSYDADIQAAAPPFTDLLLHDMGPGLADSRRQGSVAASEWRTAPLLGLGQIQRSNPRAGYLHDGRALTIEQAILWHDGVARSSSDAFVRASREDRASLLAFLSNL
ncbi:MAG: di-heme oxidoredictase family protein [Candidatus Latescibacteria bacterium]|jgi:CxxC motif-containing protein (DUF1111 family)|nr:di-heme oxidoredictase family protein [Candidatus Latescibacterota bacterium]